MFAIFYVITVTACKVISGTKNAIKNQVSRDNALKHHKTGYWNTNGAYLDSQTDEQIRYETLANGDRVIKKLNGEVIRNITKEQRDINITSKNKALEKRGNNVRLIGKFEDVCPEKLNKGIWKHVPKKTAVYVDNSGNYYFRQPTCGNATPKNVYIQISNGEFIFLDQSNDEDAKWLNKCNYGIENRLFITLSKLADRVI